MMSAALVDRMIKLTELIRILEVNYVHLVQKKIISTFKLTSNN